MEAADQTVSGMAGRYAVALFELARDAGGDQLRQALQGADIGGHADMGFFDREERIPGRKSDVACCDQIDAAADAGAMYRGDDGKPSLLERRERVLKTQDQVTQRIGGARAPLPSPA